MSKDSPLFSIITIVNKEKVYEKYLFIEEVKVLSDGKKESPSNPAVFTEEDLPF